MIVYQNENTLPAVGTAGNVFLRGGMVSGMTLFRVYYTIPLRKCKSEKSTNF